MSIAMTRQQFWDNPATLRRELYRNGLLVASWDQNTLKRICGEDRTVGPWGTYARRPEPEHWACRA